MGINRVAISGNLTRDPELRRTQSGMAIMGFGMAVNDRRKNPQTGEWEDYPNFVDVSVFGNRAESLANIVRKGMQLTVEGKLRYSSWERDGQKRSKLEVIADEIVLPPRQGGSNGYNGQQPNYTPQQQNGAYTPPQQPQNGYQQQAQQPMQQQMTANTSVYDDDIPF